jgi:hypothetical protein
MMPSAGGVFLGVVKRRNSMITDAASPASYASTEAENDSNLLVSEPLADYAITLLSWVTRGSRRRVAARVWTCPGRSC